MAPNAPRTARHLTQNWPGGAESFGPIKNRRRAAPRHAKKRLDALSIEYVEPLCCRYRQEKRRQKKSPGTDQQVALVLSLV
jgi:hypothetical protein